MINGWTSKYDLLASYRRDGQLTIKRLADVRYSAFATSQDVLPRDRCIVDRVKDVFTGWWRLDFLDYDSRKAILETNPGLLFEADVSPVRRFLTDHNCVIDPPRRVYLDIETDSRVPFSEAIQGRTRLLSWALVDEEGHRLTSVLEDDCDDAEIELWANLWRHMGEYDQVSAWNGDRFDFTVMNERCRLFGRSPRMEPYWEHRRRLLFVDQMLCYKRHHMSAESGDEKTSLALNAVCESILGEGKHDFDSGKTWEAWQAGGARRQELVDYNLQDTLLLPKLEAATGYLQLQQTIGAAMLTPVNTHTLKPMPWIDAYLLKLAHKHGTHLPSRKPGGGEVAEVEGAIVIPPTELGIHRNIHVCDFKSLYPTVIRSWNIGNDTKLPGPRDGACRAANNVWFDTGKESMLAMLCRELMGLRSHWKKEKAKRKKGTDEWKEAEQKDKAYKIACNSAYGVTGNPYFRLYDPEITGAVTAGARLLLTATADHADRTGRKNIYSDTDSCLIKGGTREDFAQFVNDCNTVLYPKILDEMGCSKSLRCIELDYEKQFSLLVFPLGTKGSPSAKRYFGKYSDAGDDGRLEIRGLEYMRTDTTRKCRRMQREAMDLIIRGYTAAEMEEWVLAERAKFFNEPVALEDIVLSKGISKPLHMYKSLPPHVRIAHALAESGDDVSEGTRISYVVVDGRTSPVGVIQASEFNGENLDRVFYWSKQIYPATMRVLAGAYPQSPWDRWRVRYPRVRVLTGQLSLT